MKNGFIKVATASPLTSVGNCNFNTKEITSAIATLARENVELILFPELCITGCSCGSLFTGPFFIKKAEEALQALLNASKESDCIIVAGLPVIHNNKLYNCAVVTHKGEIKGITTQNNPHRAIFTSSTTLPHDATAILCGQEARMGSNLLYSTPAFTFGIEIGSDADAPIAPSATLSLAGAEIILNPSAKGCQAGSLEKTKTHIETQSRRCICGYLYANAGYGESTSIAAYNGYNAIYENGTPLAESTPLTNKASYSITEIDIEKLRKLRITSKTFDKQTTAQTHLIYIAQKENNAATLTRTFTPSPFIPRENQAERYNEIFTIQSIALAKRVEHTRIKSCVIGISGGLDSTLALLVTVNAFDIIGKQRSDIIAVTMPGFGTSDRTYNNAITLMKKLGVTMREISIKEACIQHFKDIAHNIDNHDVTYENSQARERTQILMDIANQANGIVVGTGDLSELALGWATYNGDHMSMYGVNASVPKTLMQHLVRHVARSSNDEETRTTLLDIVDTPISPELTPADEEGNIKQKTEDLVGPYELHDFFLYNFVRYGFPPAKIAMMAERAFQGTHDRATIKKWLTTFFRRFFTQQFKRSCMPDGPKVGSCNLSTHDAWNMPADTSPALWIKECEEL